MIKEKLQSNDSEFQIETNNLKVSLLCPLSKIKMKLPGRSSLCKHIQCFDLETYIELNQNSYKWKCPICNLFSRFESLIIDNLFMEILSKCTDVDEIEFTSDAQWSKILTSDNKDKKSNEKITKVNDADLTSIKIAGMFFINYRKDSPTTPGLISASLFIRL
jgi:hypothetical protein